MPRSTRPEWNRKARLLAASLVMGFATLSVVILPAQVASAASDVVTNCSGDPTMAGSLPYEVANASSGDTITFANPISSLGCSLDASGIPEITLTSGPIDIATELTINGPGASDVAVSGNNATEVFNVQSAVTATISGLTIEDGYQGQSQSGGGVVNNGTLTILNSTISNNDSWNGAGIDNNYGTLIIDDSTVANNDAYGCCGGGGLLNWDGYATIARSTFSGNVANAGYGGAIWNDDAYGFLTITESTIADNDVTTGYGGGLMSEASGPNIEVEIENSTISGNGASNGGGDIYTSTPSTVSMTGTLVALSTQGSDCSGTLTDGGYNLANDGSCGLSTANNSLPSTPAGLDPTGLQSNGGPTQTIALEPGSAAISAVNNASLCATPDQRGVERPTPCDVGSYQSSTLPAFVSPSSTSVVNGQAFTLTVATTGTPTPAISVASGSSLPLGVSLTDNGNGTATLAGDSSIRALGVYSFTFQAANIAGTTTQVFTFVVTAAPRVITSPNGATATSGSLFSFTFTTTGTPAPSITEKGKLPRHFAFADNGNGTAILGGIPVVKKTKVFHLTIKATFGTGKTKQVVTQAFTLTVNPK